MLGASYRSQAFDRYPVARSDWWPPATARARISHLSSNKSSNFLTSHLTFSTTHGCPLAHRKTVFAIQPVDAIELR